MPRRTAVAVRAAVLSTVLAAASGGCLRLKYDRCEEAIPHPDCFDAAADAAIDAAPSSDASLPGLDADPADGAAVDAGDLDAAVDAASTDAANDDAAGADAAVVDAAVDDAAVDDAAPDDGPPDDR